MFSVNMKKLKGKDESKFPLLTISLRKFDFKEGAISKKKKSEKNLTDIFKRVLFAWIRQRGFDSCCCSIYQF